MGELKFTREVNEYGEVTYTARPRDDLRYTIDRIPVGRQRTVALWAVNIARDYLATPSPHFGRDMRASQDHGTLREAKAACQDHYDAERA